MPDGKRDALAEHLTEHSMGSAIYYPLPVHKQLYYQERLGYNLNLPYAEQAAREVLSLPVHPGLSQEDLEKITQTVNAFF